MSDQTIEIEGRRCVVLDADGPLLGGASGARELVEAALSEGARVVAVPVARLDGSFFDLRSGFAGELLQKAANYGLTLAIVGDASPYVAASTAFHDLVVEADRGSSVLFVADLEALRARLGAMRRPR